MKKVVPFFAMTAVTGLVLAGCGSDDQAAANHEQAADGEVFTVEDPWIKATEENLDESSDHTMTGAFVHLTNVSGEDQAIVGAEAEIAGVVELHEVIDDGGVNLMQEKEGGFLVAADETYELNPGEDHVMLMDLTEEINPGDPIEISLELENGETQVVDFIAKEYVGAQENYSDIGGHEDQASDDHEEH